MTVDMQRSLFDDEAARRLLERLSRLTADTERRWGRMTAGDMVCHLIDYFDIALGRTSAPPAVPRPLQPLVRVVLVRWRGSYPRNARTLPELLATSPGVFEQDRNRLEQRIIEFSRSRARGEWPRSPIAGKMTGAQWARLAHDHLQHHLRQFGL
jgi:hypothetical protein